MAAKQSGEDQQEIAHPARVYNYLLGETEARAADRKVGEQMIAVKPDLRPNVQANRGFLIRAVRYLAESGVTQFLDIGTGIPTRTPALLNTHQVAQRVNPAARIVCVDNDPVVLAHARALLASTSQGAVEAVEADLRQPADILARSAQVLDFSQPVAVLLLGILMYLPDDTQPHEIVRQLVAGLAPGSYLAISHTASDVHAQEAARGAARYQAGVGIEMTNRTREQVTRFFDGLQLLPPGVVAADQWRPARPAGRQLSNWAGLAIKPP